VPAKGSYEILLSSDSARFGGSGFGQEGTVSADPSPFHGYPQSVSLNLPPLGALVLAPR
jgi:1,4-alpha-glucan branching enzyme